jgi:glycyl-tRNA synthetase beta chain
MNEGLKTVTYQAKLGTVADKVARVAALAESIAGEVGVDPKLARRAAELAKADLQSRMVNEFPELQGIAGRYYAMHDTSLDDLSPDERRQLADAIDEAYMPRFAGDAIAPSKLGQVLAIAERLDTLAGGFAAGLKPTGNKDPFSLRRNALGLARTVIESDINIDNFKVLVKASRYVSNLITFSFTSKKLSDEELGRELARLFDLHVQELNEFILDRLRAYYADQGVTPQQFEAVAALMRPVATGVAPTKGDNQNSTDPAAVVGATQVATNAATTSGSLLDFDRRLKAIGEFAKLPEAEALAAANKRIRNILKKADGAIPDAVNPALFAEDAERALHAVVEQAIADTDPLLANRDYVAVLGRLARLRPEVDTFFDKVMVNADDPAIRGNRLALLQRLADRLGSVAAIEHLSV